MKQDPYWGHTNIRCHRKNLNRPHDLAPGICAPLVQGGYATTNLLGDNHEIISWAADSRFGPQLKKRLRDPTKDGLAKKFYTTFESVILSRRVSWAWSERVNVYNRQMILQRRTKTCAR